MVLRCTQAMKRMLCGVKTELISVEKIPRPKPQENRVHQSREEHLAGGHGGCGQESHDSRGHPSRDVDHGSSPAVPSPLAVLDPRPLHVGTKLLTSCSTFGEALNLRALLCGYLNRPGEPSTNGRLRSVEHFSEGRLASSHPNCGLDRVHGNAVSALPIVVSTALPIDAEKCSNRPMKSGPDLGQAIKDAMALKRLTQAQMGTEFGVNQGSVSEWCRFGRVDKKHIIHLVAFFSDVVGPDHWGLPESFSREADGDPFLTFSRPATLLAHAFESLPIQLGGGLTKRKVLAELLGMIEAARASLQTASQRESAPPVESSQGPAQSGDGRSEKSPLSTSAPRR